MSMSSPSNDVELSQHLRDIYGDEIILLDEQDESVVFRILSEFKWGEHVYTVIQSAEQRKQDEYLVFRIERNEAEELELVTIDDEEEWENVAEIYDEMSFPDENV